MKKFYRIIAGIFISTLLANSVATEHIPFLEEDNRESNIDWNGFLTGSLSTQKSLALAEILKINSHSLLSTYPEIEELNILFLQETPDGILQSGFTITRESSPYFYIDPNQDFGKSSFEVTVTSLVNENREVITTGEISCTTIDKIMQKYKEGSHVFEHSIESTEVMVEDKVVAEITQINERLSSITDVEPGSIEHEEHMQAAFNCMNELEIKFN